MNTVEQIERYTQDIRLAAGYLIKAQEILSVGLYHWVAEDLTTNFVAADLVGTVHENVPFTNLANMVTTTGPALTTLMDAGHKTNAYAIETEIPTIFNDGTVEA